MKYTNPLITGEFRCDAWLVATNGVFYPSGIIEAGDPYGDYNETLNTNNVENVDFSTFEINQTSFSFPLG